MKNLLDTPYNIDMSILETTFLKNISYVGGFVIAAEWLGFNPQSLVVLIAVMLIDTFTGVVRACYQDGGRAFTSALLKKGLLAKVLILSGLLSIGFASQGVGLGIEEYSQGVITVLILGEVYSTLGNIQSIKTGKPKVEFDAVAWLIGRVKMVLDKLIK